MSFANRVRRRVVEGIVVCLVVAGARVPCSALEQTRRVRIAVCQILVIDGDKEGNFKRIEYALQTAHDQRADIATFPESSILGWENPDAYQLATPIPGEDSNRIAELARKYHIMIAIGMDERVQATLYDSAILVDKEGKLLWKYRKLRVLPELMNPPYAVGDPAGIGVVDTEFGRVGLVICADTFGDEYAKRVTELKPDLMIVPYGWAAAPIRWPQHERDLEDLVTRRAREWSAPTVGTDLVGQMTHGPWAGETYGGASLVVSSKGKVIAMLRDRDVEVRTVAIELPTRMKSTKDEKGVAGKENR
ncbi:carbon-nitrogen hydrolase family protein [Edaphobacter flagellatus]|uniref:carbon-nitrogen hydrolase family protein n=1 Tax=Edaphobacter flagellatus TaxID=1933044 RepID=UPI0021B18FBB|nr:carbon-nitrogen hydrolase family protein [Edaphobacter flagellatus]